VVKNKENNVEVKSNTEDNKAYKRTYPACDAFCHKEENQYTVKDDHVWAFEFWMSKDLVEVPRDAIKCHCQEEGDYGGDVGESDKEQGESKNKEVDGFPDVIDATKSNACEKIPKPEKKKDAPFNAHNNERAHKESRKITLIIDTGRYNHGKPLKFNIQCESTFGNTDKEKRKGIRI